MSQMKGPAIFLLQFVSDEPPFNNLENITKWAKSLGFLGVQIPAWDKRLIDLDAAAKSKDYCDELKGRCTGNHGIDNPFNRATCRGSSCL